VASVRQWFPAARVILQVIMDGYGATARDSDPLIVPVLPKQVTVHRNSYKQADSYEITFEAGDLPFDPDLVRAGAAEIYLFHVGESGAEQRVVSRKDPLASPDPSSTRPRDNNGTLALEAQLPNSRDRFTFGNKPIIVGGFDRDDLELDTSGKWVTIAGQDYTALLAGIQWKPQSNGRARRIPTGQRLDDFVTTILAEADPGGKLRVRVRGVEDRDLPTVGKGEVANNKRGIPIEQDTSYWDVIYKTVTRYGLIAFVDGLDVVISRPKNISDGDQSTIRRMAWGRNLESLKLSRELGKLQSPTIVARSYDPATGQTLTAEYPKGEFHRAIQKVPKGAKGKFKSAHRSSTHISKTGKVTTTIRNRDEYQFITLHGVTDRAALQLAAETQYHLLGRAERKITATTRDLSDLTGQAMLNTTAGDAFTIDWDEFNREMLADGSIPEQVKVQHLVDRGFNRAVAEEIARRYVLLEGIKRPVRMREGTITFDVEDGVKIELELVDFVVQEGVRPGEGADRETREQARGRKLVKPDGKPLGWTPKEHAARKRKHR
jgi:hypothetical protein